MTISAPLTSQAIPGQQGFGQQGQFGQGFPLSGIEQTLGMPQQQTFGQYAQYPFTQQPYGSPFGAWQQPHHLQQAVQQAVIQILPYVQQAIMPQVAAQAVAQVGQQIQQQVPQVVAQLVLPYLTGQQGQAPWQQAAGHRQF